MEDAAGSPGGLAPEAEDVEDIVAAAGDWDLQVSATFGGFEEVAFLLSQPVTHRTAANAGTGRQSSAEFLNVILGRAFHAKAYARLRDKDEGGGGSDALRGVPFRPHSPLDRRAIREGQRTSPTSSLRLRRLLSDVHAGRGYLAPSHFVRPSTSHSLPSSLSQALWINGNVRRHGIRHLPRRFTKHEGARDRCRSFTPPGPPGGRTPPRSLGFHSSPFESTLEHLRQ